MRPAPAPETGLVVLQENFLASVVQIMMTHILLEQIIAINAVPWAFLHWRLIIAFFLNWWLFIPTFSHLIVY